MYKHRVWFGRSILVVALGIASSGCGPAPEGKEDGVIEQQFQQTGVVGNWMFNLWDGAKGPDPVELDSSCPPLLSDRCPLAVCAALVGDRWHSGKLFENHCRFEWGDRFHKARNYAVLQHPSEGAYVDNVLNTGQPPANAIFTPHGRSGGLMVCHDGKAPGKVWAGTCRVEWDNRIFSGTVFRYLVHE